MNVVDALLDLSHELTHFALRINLTSTEILFKKFVKEMIEGKGEVEATSDVEFLKSFSSSFEERSSCRKIYNKDKGYFSRKSVSKFYQVGKYLRTFRDELNVFELAVSDFPQISGKPSFFISSSYGLPYPLAAIREYSSILKRVCRNDLRRLQLFKDRIENRWSQTKLAERKKFLLIKKSIHSRCQKKL